MVESANKRILGSKLNTTSLKFTLYRLANTTPMTTPIATCTATSGHHIESEQPVSGVASCPSGLVGTDNYTVKVELWRMVLPAPVENAAVTVVLRHRLHDRRRLDQRAEPQARSNFGFTVKYLKNGDIQGNSLYIYRKTLAASQVSNGGTLPAGEYNWIIKSNAMVGLTQSCTTRYRRCARRRSPARTTSPPSTGRRARLQPRRQLQFQVDVTDKANLVRAACGPDTYAIRVWDTTTGTYYQLGTTAAQVAINGGNIQVRP